MADKDNPFRRPYASTRKRAADKRKKSLSSTTKNTLILRLLAFLVVVLVLALAIIFKDTGKSEIANGLLMK